MQPVHEAELLTEIARLYAALIRVVRDIDDPDLKAELAALIWPQQEAEMDDPILGTLIPAKARALVYLATVMLAAAYAVTVASIDLHWGWQAGYAAWNALAGALAVANTTRVEARP